MFRASDIFGRRAGSAPERPGVPVKASDQMKSSRSMVTNRTWDPATGQYVDEDLPDDIKQLMGVKRAKTEHGLLKAEASSHGGAWKQPRPAPGGQALGPSTVGMAPGRQQRAPKAGEVDTSAPSVEFRGFSKVDLNDRYYEKGDLEVHGRQTYWNYDATFFAYWQGDVKRWSLCDSTSLLAVRAGQYPGWAYQDSHGHISQASGWMEAWNGEWRELSLEVVFRSSSNSPPQWEDQQLVKSIATVEFKGFAMKELNTKYYLRAGEHIQGKPSFWDESGVYFAYWQQSLKRWALCDLKCLEAVRAGQCPGWAYRSDSAHLANASGWVERRSDEWVDANLETSVIGVCTKGLKVELWGFNKEDLNSTYSERPEEEVQGRVSFWDPSDTYFIYWQSSMSRWAICDRASLAQAKSGLAPGWAYRTDSQHFTRSRGWMEVWGRDWTRTNVTCNILEGAVRDDLFGVVKDELDAKGGIGVEKYSEMIRAVYEKKNPAKVKDVPKLLKKYKGREHELYHNVCSKYGTVEGAIQPQADAAAEEEEGNGGELPELSAKDYGILIQEFYLKHNPKKLADLGALLISHKHKLGELYNQVCKKYGEKPEKFYADNASRLEQVKAES